jgi:hypothetical protein
MRWAAAASLRAAGRLFMSFLVLSTVHLEAARRMRSCLNYFLRGDQYSGPEQIVDLDTEILQRVRHLPGVQAAGLTNLVPGAGYYGN